MRTSEFILSNTKNITYYTDKIKELISKQYSEELESGQDTDKIGTKSIKFNAINNIYNMSLEIKFFCECIENNVKIFEREEKKIEKEKLASLNNNSNNNIQESGSSETK